MTTLQPHLAETSDVNDKIPFETDSNGEHPRPPSVVDWTPDEEKRAKRKYVIFSRSKVAVARG